MYFLGKLCKRGHQWETTGQSLRYVKRRECVECERERRATDENKEIARKALKKHRETEKYQQTYADRRATSEHKAKMAIAQAKYGKTEYGKETRKKAEQKHNQTDQRKASKKLREQNRPVTDARRLSWKRKNAKRDRLKQGNSEFYTASDVAARWAIFDNSCAFCGKSDTVLTQDHFFPLNNGGSDAIWNLVPACFSCNSSKQDDAPEKWYRSRAFFNEDRWALLCSLMYNEEALDQIKERASNGATQMRMEFG
jgi:5-methylcytosine-specific restriction endonuclease McrA